MLVLLVLYLQHNNLLLNIVLKYLYISFHFLHNEIILENSNYYDDISFPVICWGMGAHLRRVFSKPAFPKPVSAIIDRDRGGHGESWQGIPLVTADILREEQYAQSTVLITSVLYADEIKHQLANMGFRGKVLTAF